MKVKKFFTSVLSCLLSICILGSCTQKVPQQSSPQTSDSTKPTTGQTEITFAFYGSPVEKDVITSAINSFMDANPDIKVNIQFVVTDYNTKLTTMVAGNVAPDIAYCEPELAMPWAEDGKILNVMDLLKDDPELTRNDFLDDIWYDWEEGKSIGTNSACEAVAVFYNKKLTTAAEVTVPTTADTAWTWDEFVENAKKLTLDINGKNAADPNFDPENIKQYGVNAGTWWGQWLNAVYSNGGDYLNEDGTEFALNKPEAVEAIQKWADLINVHHVSPSPIQASSLPAAAVALQTEQIAMTIDGQWALLDLEAAGLDFGVGVLPKIKKSVTLVLGAPTVIFSSTEHPQEAWKLYKWLANPETSLDLHKGGVWMPLMKKWYTEPELLSKWAENNPAHPEGYVDAVVKQTLNNAIPGPLYSIKNFANIDAIVTPALDQVWMGEKTAQVAMDEIADAVNAELRGKYGQ